MIYTFTCPHCEHEQECKFTPARRAPHCSNPDSPAFADSGDCAELELTDECPACGKEIDYEQALEHAEETCKCDLR